MFLFILFKTVLLSVSLGMECSSPYISLETGCYYFSGDQTANWWQAAEACRGLHGILVVIDDHEENEAIRQYLIQTGTERSSFIGGYDMGHEGDWKWESTRKPIDFFDWVKNEPNNWSDKEHCLELNKFKSFHWNDVKCTDKTNSFICEALPETKGNEWQLTGVKIQIEPVQQPLSDLDRYQVD